MRKVFTRNLREGMVLKNDIFAKSDGIVPLVTKGTVLTAAIIAQMMNHEVSHVYISHSRELDKMTIPEAMPVIDRALQKEAVETVQDLFAITRLDESDIHQASFQIVRHIDDVVDRLIDSVRKDEGALVNISDLKSYDEYTYHHSLSVAVLSIAIGQSLHFSDSSISELGKCAIMHDIGKTLIPVSIINKPGKLDPEEFALVKTHSAEGSKYLMSHRIGDRRIWEGVMGHHEKLDGTGYPHGLAGDEIPIAARIISVADVYDALTSNRSYRSPMQPAEAVEYLMGNVGKAFDFDILTSFLNKLELYPIGSFVELSDRRIAVVHRNQHPMRPVVQILGTGEMVDLYMDRRYLSITVAKALPDHFIAAAQ